MDPAGAGEKGFGRGRFLYVCAVWEWRMCGSSGEHGSEWEKEVARSVVDL